MTLCIRQKAAETSVQRILKVAIDLGLFVLALQAAGSTLAEQTPVNVPGGYYFNRFSIEGRTQEQRGIVWLDNTRVMFKGNRLGEGGNRQDVGIYIWDIVEGKVSRYGDEDNLCYSAGKLYLWQSPVWTKSSRDVADGQFVQRYRYGGIGEEKAGVCRGDGRGKKENCLGEVNMSCERIAYGNTGAPLGANSRVLVNLRTHDGVIVANPRRGSLLHRKLPSEEVVRISRLPVVLVNHKNPRGKQLPIQEVEEIGAGFTAFSEYAQKYTLVGAIPKNGVPGRFTNWPTDVPQTIYMLPKNGDVEELAVPKLPDWTRIHLAMPSQIGMVYWGSHGRTGGGLFLYDGKRTGILDRGQVSTFAVSPDGCKVAYAIINNYNVGPSLDYKIKYLTVCQRD